MSQGIHTSALARPFAALGGVLLAAALLLLPSAPAQAHDELLGSNPAAGATLDAAPAKLTLTFSGAIATDAGASEVAVTDAAGTSLTDGDPVAQDNVLTQALSGEASGAVTVLWKVVSSDGHPISGEFSFTVAGAATPTPTTTASPEPTSTPTSTRTPEPSASPTTPPADTGSSAAWPWVLAGIIVVALAGGVTYLLVSRSRRERRLRGGSGPGSQPPAED